MAQDVVDAVAQFLLAQSDVIAAVGTDPVPWVFQRIPGVRLKSTQKTAVVVALAGAWTTPNQHNTMQFPRVLIECYGDPTRDPATNVSIDDGETKALATWRAVNAHLHRPQGGVLPGVDAAGLRIIGSLRLDEPDPIEVPEGDGLMVVRTYYGLEVA